MVMRVRTVLHALLLWAATAVTAAAQESRPFSQSAPTERPDLVILHMNDFHGQVLPRRFDDDPARPPKELGGFATLVRFVAQERARFGAENVWVTDAGDWFQGTPEGNEDKGASIVECFNRLGLVAAQIGNHEYDFGEDNLAAIVALARFPVLGANIVDATKRAAAEQPASRPYARPFLVREHHDVRIAIVGLITQDTKNVATGPFGAADFADEVETLERLMPQLSAASDAVILLTHCGTSTDRRLAQRFPNLLLILGGHSHEQLRPGLREGNVLIVQAGSKGGGMTRVSLALNRQRRTAKVLSSWFEEMDAGRIGKDPAAEAFVTERFGKISAPWDQVIGRLEGDVGRGSRRTPNSTAAGNLIAGLIREVAEADVGLTNKGGLRTGLRLGPITRREVYELVPFDNSVVAFRLTGAQLRSALEHGLAPKRQPLEIDGGTYEYSIQDGKRILGEVKVAGQRVEDAKIYRVATNSFLAGGGDGIEVFSTAERLPQSAAMQRYLRDLLIEKLLAQKSLNVTAEGRIRPLH